MSIPPKRADGSTARGLSGGFSLSERALSGFVWLSMGNGVRAVLKIAVLAVLARLLSPEAFGVVAAAGVVVWFSLIFSNLGVAPALVQRRELTHAHTGTAFVSSVGLGFATGASVFVLAPGIAGVFRIPELTPVLQVMALIFPVTSVAVVSECLLQRELRFRALAAIELVSYALGYGAAGIAMAWLGFGVWALVGAELTKSAIKSTLLLHAMPPRRPAFDRTALGELLGFGAGYTATALSTYFAAQADSFVVGRYLGASALGLYGRAYELMLAPAQALGVLLDKVLFPTLARVQNEPAQLRLAFRRCMTMVALLVLPAAGATIILAPEIVQALLGPAWTGAIIPLQILALGMYFRVSYMVGHALAHALGAVRQTAWRNAAHAASVIAAAIIGQRWGLPGVAFGVVLAITIHFFVVLQLGVSLTGVRWREIAELHIRASLVAVSVCAPIWAAAIILRALEAPAVLTLALAGSLTVIAALVLLRVVPRLAGEDGVWIAVHLHRYAPARIKPYLGTHSVP